MKLAADSSNFKADSFRDLFQEFQCLFQVQIDELYPPKQTKILKNAFKRTNGNRNYRSLTLIKKTHENAFIGVFCNFMSVKTAQIPVFER